VLGSLSIFLWVLNLVELTRLSSDGQVPIPQSLRIFQNWQVGQELTAINFGDGILLKPKNPFTVTTLEQVGGCLKYQGSPKTLDEIEDGIRTGVMEHWRDCS